MYKDSIISDIKRLAKSILPAGSSVTLFGSRARGNERPDSDWDILILLSKEGLTNFQKENYAYPFVELGWQVNAEINPIVHSANEWASRHHLPLYHNIKSEGIKIWD